jgi:acetyl-CoA synthetase
MRIEYQLGVTLVSSFLVVVASFIVKLALLPDISITSSENIATAPETPTTFTTTSTVSVTSATNTSVSSMDYQPTVNKPRMSFQEYKALYSESLEDPDTFWGTVATDLLSWTKPFTKVFEPGTISRFDGFKWFSDGQLNACFNAVDKPAMKHPDKVALIWEPNDPSTEKTIKITYKQLLASVKQVAHYLKYSVGVKKGDRVTIFMPQIPETLYAILACARIGAIHNVVFAGFAWESLQSRLIDSESKVILTVNAFSRGPKLVEMKKIVDQALLGCPFVTDVIVLRRSELGINVMKVGRDIWWSETIESAPEECDCEPMNAEDPLFILYTSGSTGKPKALLHTTAGYLVYSAYTFKTMFDYQPEDVYFSTADAGWITGHSYGIYGPLVSGATMIWLEGIPTHPTPSRLWQIINEHKVNQLYTAPTLLRMLKRLGDEHVLECKSLRILGSVGEPIDPPSWNWYNEVVGRKQCAIVDTYWQTETGGHLISTIPGVAPVVPGYAGLPFFGIEPEIVPFTSESNSENHGVGALVIKRPWPGMARSIYNDPDRFKQVYLQVHPGVYYAGDGASRDGLGNYRIHGRIDDVINVAGHRVATAEIEGALNKHNGCSEAAVLGKRDDLTGEAIVAFCLLTPEYSKKDSKVVALELRELVRNTVGPVATPKHIYFPSDLPKTRSGKIMRRVLRKLLVGERELGDLSTLMNPEIVEEIRSILAKVVV